MGPENPTFPTLKKRSLRCGNSVQYNLTARQAMKSLFEMAEKTDFPDFTEM